MFHGNLVHGSAPNITPYPRRIVYLTLCAVSNYIRKPTRPEWIAHRDFAPIEPVADNALLDYARAYHPHPSLPRERGRVKEGVAAE
jgi:ectoine hydroxylase